MRILANKDLHFPHYHYSLSNRTMDLYLHFFGFRKLKGLEIDTALKMVLGQ